MNDACKHKPKVHFNRIALITSKVAWTVVIQYL